MDKDTVFLLVGLVLILGASISYYWNIEAHRNETGICTEEGYVLYDGSKLKSDGTTNSRNYQIALMDSVDNGNTVN